MEKQVAAGWKEGFYKKIVECLEVVDCVEEEKESLVVGEVLEEDVYEVGRVMECRRKNVSIV